MTIASPKIGFIGLGIMGAPMAGHLIAAGYQLFVHTLRQVPEAIASTRATQCVTARGVAERADIVFVMVPDTPDVERVLFDEVGGDNLFLQYDIYHAQRTEGELAATLQRHLPRIAHVQIADNPGRNEPGSGEINFPFLFGHLARAGYTGWIGCEYKPATSTAAGLGWMNDYPGLRGAADSPRGVRGLAPERPSAPAA